MIYLKCIRVFNIWLVCNKYVNYEVCYWLGYWELVRCYLRIYNNFSGRLL